MSTILMALSMGGISLVIVFISGLMSGVVRIGTITLRSLFAFCIASVVSYFLLMLFNMYDEYHKKMNEQINAELSEDEENSEGEEQGEEQSEEEGFKPMDNFPHA